MDNAFYLIYYVTVLIALVIGVLRFKRFDNATRIIAILLVATAICELLSFSSTEKRDYFMRCNVYHIYSIVEIFLQSLFFIYAIKPSYYRELITVAVFVWPLLGMLNILFLQPFNTLNNNMLMLESCSTIIMSLYFIYWLLKNDKVKSIFHYPHFWVAVLWLLLWSGTFFFWAFVRILYSEHWVYFKMVDRAQNVINIIVYAGIAAVLILYPKNLEAYENN